MHPFSRRNSFLCKSILGSAEIRAIDVGSTFVGEGQKQQRTAVSGPRSGVRALISCFVLLPSSGRGRTCGAEESTGVQRAAGAEEAEETETPGDPG